MGITAIPSGLDAAPPSPSHASMFLFHRGVHCHTTASFFDGSWVRLKKLRIASVKWASHTTGWLRTLPLRSVISAHLSSCLSPRNTPRALVWSPGQHDFITFVKFSTFRFNAHHHFRVSFRPFPRR